ncbi:hypothetical protein LEP1GSC103_3793 [Leptospira borgpetersenii serovar Javanica str. UI 09931]|uniref:Uncharacterized protein n=5 Tax=Leptospira borgpetersenii TaxID=174 RepID=M3HSG1_LEPBO|nr:hypothetical protein LBBP_00820 [Leptospira borgpetersenii serovar Ballum]EKP15279.1 hypothetical protein LEP1GSC128_2023 [Leptospira borgpetersenii str. 200801926]EKQ93060.1 hypothetical protein LEP1GSC101_3926 [Leptospira borgpetersenii str. UI 09149]EKQ98462.1 hypothetical protein LEP1GSC121_3452 [Leptospira borgpetersenii serovar Castellonis str. 200801910]EMG00991.1 hypothetical protein LEP1GSC123_3675 [Leptospira borgpetersenii str. 200701203]EMK09442.1 hypothetical protein LEP1GSC066
MSLEHDTMMSLFQKLENVDLLQKNRIRCDFMRTSTSL